MPRAGCVGSCKGGLEITAREKFLNSSLSAFPIPVNSVKQANSLTVQHTYILPQKCRLFDDITQLNSDDSNLPQGGTTWQNFERLRVKKQVGEVG